MTRVSTAGNYQSALLNLMSAQAQQSEAQNRLATEKVATDMTGFGRGAENLTALKAAAGRIQGFINTGEAVAARLDTQDLALTQIGDGITNARTAISAALASENIEVLMLELQGNFQVIQTGLNTQHQGDYLFSGSNSSTPPVTAKTLAELAAAPVADTFTNDQLATVSRLSEKTTVQTGYLANEVGGAVFEILRDIQAYHADPATGPLTGKPTDAQKAFLNTQITRLGAAVTDIVNVTSRNGTMQKQLETINANNTAQVNGLEKLVSNKTDADLAQAVTDIQLSQLAVQASAQVISQLSQTSLLNYLR